MEENNKKTTAENFKMSVVNMARSLTPLPTEISQGASDDKYVKYGDDNLFPNFLLQLFHEVPLHNGISKTKLNYVMGDGLVTKADGKKADFSINDIDSLEEVVRKLVIDYLIFNYFTVEIQYNVFNEIISYNHIPANHVRANKSKTKFWVCDDWSAKKNVLTYDRWIKGKNEDGKTKIFFYQQYLPSVNNVYPLTATNAANIEMYTEILIKEFNKNNIEDGFSPSHIISFFKGIPTADQAKDLSRKFEAEFKGSTGKKFLLNHNDQGSEKGVQVDQVAGVDYAGALAEVGVRNTQAILTVHQASSRVLFGVEVAGSLGDKNSIETSFQLFKGLFVLDTRNVIESGLNKIFKDGGFPEIEFKDKSNILNVELDSTTREKVLTIDELRILDSRPILPNGLGTGLIGAVNMEPAPSKFSAIEDDKYKNGRVLTGDDFELIKDFGVARSNFDLVDSTEFHFHTPEQFSNAFQKFDDEKDIDNYLMKEDINGKELSELKADIKKDLGLSITSDDLVERIKTLTDAKIIRSEVVDGKVKIEPVEPEKRRAIEVMYEYKVRPGMGKPLIDTSRGFCVRLIENDRLYSRSQISEMDVIFGYRVFEHCGGWYFNSKTQKSENQCRHFWNKVSVSRKSK